MVNGIRRAELLFRQQILKIKKILFLISISLFINCNCFAQGNYSTSAIQIFNAGVAYHKQHNFELAEQKYSQALKVQPDFVEAKKNLSVIYYTKAWENLSAHRCSDSIAYAQKALSDGYSKAECYHVMMNCYKENNDYENIILIGNKLKELTPNDAAVLDNLALAYLKTHQDEKARKMYYEVLLINPKDNVAQQNLKYISYVRNEQFLNNSVNNLPVVPHAPVALYRLIKPSGGITKNTVEKTKYILDLIWNEPNGQMLLQQVQDNKIPINITQGAVTANAQQQKKTNTLMLYGFIPIFSYDTASNSVNIAFNYISDFYNPNIDPRRRIYDLQVFIHEFGHAYMFSKTPGHKDAIEEELGVSMLGYNSAYKIITGQYLTREQAIEYSVSVLQSLLSDSHRDLPVHNGFNNEIQYYGIRLPYPEIYSNLPQMYKKLLYEGKVSPVPNFYVYGK